MAIVRGQQVAGTGSAGVATAAMVSVTAGNCLMAICANSSGSTNPFTVTDNSGSNTWALLGAGFQSGGANTRIEIWVALNVVAGSYTITATGGTTSAGVVGIEWSGVATASATDVTAAGGNVTATTFGNVGQTTTNANDVLVIAINYNTVSGANTATDNNVGGIWTANSAASISSMVAKSDYAVVSATGTYSNTWTVGTTQTSGWAFASLKGASVAINSVSAITKVFGLG